MRGLNVKGVFPASRQGGHVVGPDFDRGADGVVLVGRDADGLLGEGDVIVATGPQGRSRRRPKGFDSPEGSWHLS
jgi:hypothetical protein